MDMASVNKVILIGHLGKDPEVRYTTGGDPVASLSLATSESWTDKKTGEKVEKTEWWNVSFFGKLADVVGQYLKKGSMIYVEGRGQTDEWEKDGVKRYSFKVIGDRMQMLGGKQGGNQDNEDGHDRRERQAPQEKPGAGTFVDLSDDIPFFDDLGRNRWRVI
jgi:single-strand DNA-binding protein